jgi:iron complex transport system substrate-binding protein
LAVAAILLALVLAGCGSGGESSSVSTETTAAPQGPDRIISLSPAATEMLFAIGAGKQVVAVDDQSNFPANAPRTKLSGYEPNVEAIAGYAPDLVIASFDPGGLADGLDKLNVPVLLQPAPKNLAGAYAEIQELGTMTGHAERAKQVVQRMRSQIAALVASASAAKGMSVYHELGPDYYSATSRTFIGSVYEKLGLENIADAAGGKAPDYPQLSAEYVLHANPDLIVLSDTKCCGQTRETVAKRPGWKKVAAVREGNVVGVDDDIASRWGPRIVAFVRLVSQAMAAASR